jgi:hypothetical protein
VQEKGKLNSLALLELLRILYSSSDKAHFIIYLICIELLQQAEDYSGPQKEFFRLALNAIKEKYFDHGVKEHLSEDYKIVGAIIGK